MTNASKTPDGASGSSPRGEPRKPFMTLSRDFTCLGVWTVLIPPSFEHPNGRTYVVYADRPSSQLTPIWRFRARSRSTGSPSHVDLDVALRMTKRQIVRRARALARMVSQDHPGSTLAVFEQECTADLLYDSLVTTNHPALAALRSPEQAKLDAEARKKNQDDKKD